jgi:hypothetical protein
MPNKLSVCAAQFAIARSDRVDVMTTRPFASPEYIRSLSDEMKTALTGCWWVRKICNGDGGGGAAIS